VGGTELVLVFVLEEELQQEVELDEFSSWLLEETAPELLTRMMTLTLSAF